MIIKNAEFITSVANDKNFLVYTDKPIIAVSGKSNVGKSSLVERDLSIILTSVNLFWLIYRGTVLRKCPKPKRKSGVNS